jgi:hypothetical protein
LEAWRKDHPDHAIFTMRARHYYEGWLPLSKKVRRLFPPLGIEQQEVTFHHHFGDEPESFHAYVDRDAGRVWVSPEMYDTFRSHGIYPGARLRLSARNEQQFDLATRPADKAEPIHVWQMWLNEDGEIEYDEFEEQPRYDIDDDVYVADVRFEDREALFRQAEETGAGVYQLMYEKAVEWWEENDPESLVVTADQLFDAIHFDEQGRMVSKATIGWELWKRLAFKPLGGGRYRFRPEFGGEVHSAVPSQRVEPEKPMTPPEAEAYFIFQQRPDSEYADRAGEVYNWRKGIPGSLQIVEGARFIYYRPGEQIFFGTGRVASIDTYTGEDGETYYNGYIVDYEPWDPPLPLTPELARRVNFISPDRLGVGQAGIRKISRDDFLTISRLYDQGREAPRGAGSATGAGGELWDQVVQLEGQTLHTLARPSPFKIATATEEMLTLELEGGTRATIPRDKLESAYAQLVGKGEILRSEIAAFLPWDSSYAAAVLAALPSVKFKTNPLRLFYEAPFRQPRESVALATERTRSGQLVATDLVPPGPLFEKSAAEAETPKHVEESQSRVDASSGSDIQAKIDAEFEQIRAIIEDSLVGETVHTLAQRKPNQILDSDDEGLTVLARTESKVRWDWIKDVYEALCRLGEIEPQDVQKGEFQTPGGYRGAFIFALLARFAHVEARTKPRRKLIYHEPEGPIRLRKGSEEEDTLGAAPSEPASAASESPASVSALSRPSREAVSTSREPDDMQTKTLFSQHYLQKRLPDHPEWQEDPRAVFEAVRELWQRAREYGDTWNESQTEQEFIQPVLDLLGWAYIVQPKAHQAGQVRRPDYALFPDDATKDDAAPHQGDDAAFYSRVPAIAEAKYWGRSLSQRDTGGREKWDAQSNPSHQMVSYLVGTRVGWGILTNGLTWRLYSREVSSTASEYYEVDLGLIFDSLPDDGELTEEQAAVLMDQFRRWWLFFRQRSFVPDAQGRSFVERVQEGSDTYARRISDTLKTLVYEKVMPEIAGGFVAYRHRQKGVEEETEQSLRQIYRSSLSLLYKLLFLLYGEARALLPVDNPSYREQSLTMLAQWAATRIDKGLVISDATHATLRYDGLRALFHRIDQGDPSLGIPRYDGGLFDPSSPENQFLEAHKLSDRAVARAVDTLVRDAGEPVDYAYIGVQNLGSIYEGLLENRLRVVDAAAGEVELIGDQGERKATGSYYTPDYIVEYIVQHTLDPILEERDQAFQSAMDRCAQLRGQLKKVSDATTVRRLRSELDEAERDVREAFLGIKVLDPAMGSGHFLVSAVDHLTDAIIRRMQVYYDQHPDVLWDWNPIQRLIEQVRGAILAEMERQGIQVHPARLDDTALLTRLVMKRCIYGVDLNRMAVELAKVSLWLHTFTVGAPLSFLDHHLRWGNSLIGTDVRTVEQEIQKTEAGQLSLWQGPFAGLLDLTGLMVEVVERADATLADVQRSAETFKQFQKELTPYKQVLDLWVSQYFGNGLAQEFLTVQGDAVVPALKGKQDVLEKYEDAITEARQLYEEGRFFHWDLEFPEVFVDLRERDWAENPGFDAVIGNPPYVRIQTLTATDPTEVEYYNGRFRAATGKYDIYVLFIEESLEWLADSGYFGMVVPNKFVHAQYGTGLRKLLVEENLLHRIVDFGDEQVFEDSSIYTCLVFLNQTEGAGFTYAQAGAAEPLEISEQSASLDQVSDGPWHFALGKMGQVLEKLLALPMNLGDISQEVFQGVITGGDVHFVVLARAFSPNEPTTKIRRRDSGEEFSVETSILRSFAKGAEIRDYHIEHTGTVLLYPYVQEDGETELLGEVELKDQYPLAYSYLSKFKEPLASRGSAKMEYPSWYAHWCPRAIWKFESPKIITPVMAESGRFYVDQGSLYFNGSGGGGGGAYGIILADSCDFSLDFLGAVLNSNLSDSFMSQISSVFRGGYYAYNRQYIERIPIRVPAFTTPLDERERLVTVGTTEATEWIEATEGGSVESAGFSAFSGSDFGRWVEERLSPIHTPDPQLVREHNADSLNEDWQLPEEGPVEQSDVVHDLLAHLAEQMIDMHKERQRLEEALDPFKYLDRGVSFVPFTEAFADEIKYGQRISEPVDLGPVHHDIDGLRLVEVDGGWELQVQLKKRDPEAGWEEWLYESEHSIARKWVPAYRLLLDDEKARYYQHAFEVLDEFAEAKSFPGGYTRSTEKKLRLARVPAFDEEADLAPLVELSKDLAEVRDRIATTDRVIDFVVYRLYGLTEEEVAVVEDGSP